MKKLVFLFAVVFVLYFVFMIGLEVGINHAICDSEIWITCLDAYEQYDVEVHIDLDGDTYTHGAYIGRSNKTVQLPDWTF